MFDYDLTATITDLDKPNRRGIIYPAGTIKSMFEHGASLRLPVTCPRDTSDIRVGDCVGYAELTPVDDNYNAIKAKIKITDEFLKDLIFGGKQIVGGFCMSGIGSTKIVEMDLFGVDDVVKVDEYKINSLIYTPYPSQTTSMEIRSKDDLEG